MGSPKLNQLGIHTVWDLATQPSNRIQARFNVVVARTVLELNGIPCLELEEIAPDKQQIVCSRSFSRRLTEYRELSQAMAEFCSRAAEKLRRQQSVTGCITVFIRTSPFNPKEPQYQRAASVKLDAATQGFYAQTAENSASLLDNDFIGQNRLIFASSDMGVKF